MQSILDWLAEASSSAEMPPWEREALPALQGYAKAIQGALSDDFLDGLTAELSALRAGAERDAFLRGFRLGAGLLLELGWTRLGGGE